MSLSVSLETHFADLPDPREPAKCQHKLLDMVIIAVCATIANADDWQGIVTFAQAKADWLEQWLDLPNGIPSHDTFERVFGKLDMAAFESRFIAWTQDVFKLTTGQVVAIDGKTVRGSGGKRAHEKLHLVSAWATVNSISLGQCKVDSKTNEITVIPELLEMLAVKGCIVTLDAMGCQTAIAQKIVDQEADYVLAVKGNQKTLHKHIESAFIRADDERLNRQMAPPDVAQTQARGHGRLETRVCRVLPDDTLGDWAGAQSIVQLTCERRIGDRVECETRYFISSLPPKASLLLGCIRAHWGIENSFHWVLDVVFGEDANPTRHQGRAQGLAVLRRMALNLLKRHPSKKSLRQKRYRAALKEQFLLEVLTS